VNWELFAAFMVVATILFITPGPVVTLVIATGASHGIRVGLTTVAGCSVGFVLVPRVALEAGTREAAGPPIRRAAGRRRRLAVAGAATGRA
jgi:hypothetical protein